VTLPDEVDELLRLADQRERLDRLWRERADGNPDPDDDDAHLLRCLSYSVGKHFWRLAYQLGDRIGWEPGCVLPTNPFDDEPGNVG
jgi:hypothetical protein